MNGLVTWALATFHASALVLVAVVVAYRAGGLSGPLAELNTLVGFALFGGLWATTVFATGRAVAGLGWSAPGTDAGGTFAGRAARWGGLNGALFLALFELGAGLVAALSAGPQVVLFALGFAVIALPFAFVVGAVIGLAFGAIDLLLLAASRALVRRALDEPAP